MGNNAGRFVRGEVPKMPQLHRLHALLEILKEKRYPSKSQLIEKLEVSARQFDRDLAYLRDQRGIDVRYDYTHRGYCYDGELYDLPAIPLTENELFALLIAQQALDQYLGTVYHEPLRQSLEKIATCLNDSFSMLDSANSPVVSFRNSGAALADAALFQQLSKAIIKRQLLEIHYESMEPRALSWRTIEPKYLSCINGRWYLIAFSRKSGEHRSYVVSRIKEVKETGGSFPPSPFDIDDYLKHAIGIYRGEDKLQVVLEFDAVIAPYIQEGNWHAGQQFETLPDGRLRMAFAVTATTEAVSFVLRWSPHVTVVEPAELIAEVRDAAQQMVERHETVPVAVAE
ncbi:MAG: helix-turn-helix type 11 domain-containing protein [Puniceicoccaceae bacterium 5H]|nr:MAG: helix-turn-helix type 11 domain-containing protein [Puniceicoccaceae bacterium 5H]